MAPAPGTPVEGNELRVVDDAGVRYVFCAGLWWWLRRAPVVEVWTTSGALDGDLGAPAELDMVMALECCSPGLVDRIWDALTGVTQEPR
jgi:hypothetical protein